MNGKLSGLVGSIVIGLIIGCLVANASYPKDLWKGIIGEAVSEGYDGMYAVTCVS